MSNYYIKNKDKILAARKIKYAANKELYAARAKASYNKHRKLRIEEVKKYYKLNRQINLEKIRKRYSSDPVTWARKEKVKRDKLRGEVINAYGGKCNCCGESELVFLALDHVNGGGRKDMKENGTKAHYRRAKRENYPPTFQVLCHNCNMAKHINGICPHKVNNDNLRHKQTFISCI